VHCSKMSTAVIKVKGQLGQKIEWEQTDELDRDRNTFLPH